MIFKRRRERESSEEKEAFVACLYSGTIKKTSRYGRF